MLSGAWHKDEGVNFGRKGTVSVCCWLTLLCPAQGLAWSQPHKTSRWLKLNCLEETGQKSRQGSPECSVDLPWKDFWRWRIN